MIPLYRIAKITKKKDGSMAGGELGIGFVA
jgi:hypothetical protein